MTTEPLSFTLNGQSYSITPTTVNPLSNAPATNGNWLYYLHYYSNTNGQPDILTCNTNTTNQTVYVCAFAPGGAGGLNSNSNTEPFGGGGGGGQCVNKEFVSSATVTLNPIASSSPTTIQSSTFISSTNSSGVFTLKSGGPGANGSSYNGANGANGGVGGGAGGNGAGEGSRCLNPGVGGKAGIDSGTGFSANNGNGYNGAGGYGNYNYNTNVVSTYQAFSDGTFANLASGGMSGYGKNGPPYTYIHSKSGNPSGVMFYCQV
jgi:hypothetical protein